LPVPLRGLYLAGAGCYGGPGITFIPGYNAGYRALEDASELIATNT
jgi:phytoene dehydrogenase-like protein